MELPRVVKIYHNKEYKVVILYKQGYKFTKAAIQTGSGVKTIRLKNKDIEKALDVWYKEELYPVQRAKKLFAKSAERGKMNQEIKELLYGTYECS